MIVTAGCSWSALQEGCIENTAVAHATGERRPTPDAFDCTEGGRSAVLLRLLSGSLSLGVRGHSHWRHAAKLLLALMLLLLLIEEVVWVLLLVLRCKEATSRLWGSSHGRNLLLERSSVVED